MQKRAIGERKSYNVCRTNGDLIIDGGIKALTEFLTQKPCFTCVYWKNNHCNRPKDKKCAAGIEAWLNAPAESEGENANS